jgi:hypothetical protein
MIDINWGQYGNGYKFVQCTSLVDMLDLELGATLAKKSAARFAERGVDVEFDGAYFSGEGLSLFFSTDRSDLDLTIFIPNQELKQARAGTLKVKRLVNREVRQSSKVYKDKFRRNRVSL